jgi:hypothetical protein
MRERSCALIRCVEVGGQHGVTGGSIGDECCELGAGGRRGGMCRAGVGLRRAGAGPGGSGLADGELQVVAQRGDGLLGAGEVCCDRGESGAVARSGRCGGLGGFDRR